MISSWMVASRAAATKAWSGTSGIHMVRFSRTVSANRKMCWSTRDTESVISSRGIALRGCPSISTSPRPRLVDAGHQRRNRRLARPAGADDRHPLAGLDDQAEALEQGLAVVLVAEGDVAQLDPAFQPQPAGKGRGPVPGGVGNGLEEVEVLVGVEHVVEALQVRLQDLEHVGELDEAPDRLQEVHRPPRRTRSACRRSSRPTSPPSRRDRSPPRCRRPGTAPAGPRSRSRARRSVAGPAAPAPGAPSSGRRSHPRRRSPAGCRSCRGRTCRSRRACPVRA